MFNEETLNEAFNLFFSVIDKDNQFLMRLQQYPMKLNFNKQDKYENR